MGFQRLNKKGLEFKSALFSIVVFSMIIISIGIIVGGWNNAYNAGLDYDLGNYDQLDNISTTAGGQKDRINPSTGRSGDDSETFTYRGVFAVIANIFDSFNVVFGNNGMLDSITERFMLPDYIRQGLVTLMVLAIVFSIIAIIFRLTRGSA